VSRSIKLLSSASKFSLVPYIVILTGAQLLQFMLNPYGSFQGDSSAYGFGSTRDWSLLSFTGQALRNWPLVLVNLTLGNQILQVGFLFLLSTISWSYLFSQTRYISIGISRHILCLLLLILAISPQVITWNSVLLSESISISLLICIVGVLLGLTKIRNSRDYVLLVILCITWISIKPSNFLVFSIALVIFICGITFIPKFRRKFAQSLKKHRIILAAVVFLVSWISIVNWNQSKQEFQYQLDYRTVAALTVLSEQNFQSPETIEELNRTNRLACSELSKPASMVENFKKFDGNCQEDKEWLSSNFSKWYAKFLVLHPEVVGKLFFFGVLAGNSPFGFYSGSVSILPQSIGSMFFGQRNYALRLSETSEAEFSLETFVVVTPIIGWILIFLILQTRGRFSSLIRIPRNVTPPYSLNLSLVVFVLSIIGLSTLTVFSPTEWFRQTVQFQVLLFVSTLIALSQELEAKLKGD
jgi:hypothetical protein